MAPTSPKAKFFLTLSAWRDWLEQNHAKTEALWVGLYKRDSGRPSITWPEAVDGALCYGWIDGLRKRVDENSYKIRFTPRKPGSTWSAINIRRVDELLQLGLMHASGMAVFEKRDAVRSKTYSYEQRRAITFPEDYETQLRSNAKAWSYFEAKPAWYRRTAAFWVISAKREETRLKRLALLIQYSSRRKEIPPLSRPKTKR